MRRYRNGMGLWVIVLIALAACSGNPSPNVGEGPRLVRDVAAEPTDVLPTRIISPTPDRSPTPATLEVISPEQQITVQADFVLVTPTLPPSKTPTTTPTVSATPSMTPTPSVTVTATATFQAFPTSIISPIIAPIVEPRPVICDTQWFFIQPRPQGCPTSPVTASRGVYQPFQNGYMIWVASLDAIYVMYNDPSFPRWEVWRDEFDEGEMEVDPNWGAAPAPNLWQPRRGFGQLWRREAAVRDRIGWGTIEMEIPYSTQLQIEDIGTVFVNDAQGGVFALMPGNGDWQRYMATTGGGFPGFGS